MTTAAATVKVRLVCSAAKPISGGPPKVRGVTNDAERSRDLRQMLRRDVTTTRQGERKQRSDEETRHHDPSHDQGN